MVCTAVVTGQIVRWYQILWVYGVYSCCDWTDSRVISDILAVGNLETSQSICISVSILYWRSKLRNATVRLIMPISLSLCLSLRNEILSRYFCGFFENLTIILIFHCSLVAITSALQQTALHLRCRLAENLL